jgi:SAM-dependent methyltransferase
MSTRMDAPSPWIVRWASVIPAQATVLDVACGSGRHLRWLAARGHRVTGIDRNGDALALSRGVGELIEADLEAYAWPLDGRRFDAVVVTNYLWRALMPTLVASVAPGGVLLYETFALGHQRLGKPSNPDFLLQPGELLSLTAGLRVLGYEDGLAEPPLRCVQRIAAWRSPEPDGLPPRLPASEQGLEFHIPQDAP